MMTCQVGYLCMVPCAVGLLGTVFIGWLADAKLGNYKVLKCSFILLFLLSGLLVYIISKTSSVN